MAFPTATITTGLTEGSSGTSHVITMPAVAAGDLAIVSFCDDQTAVFTWPGSPAWTSLIAETANGANNEAETRYRIITGTEGWGSGGSFTITTDVAQAMAAIVIVIPAATWHGTTPPEATAYATANSVNPNPGSLSPSWGAEDTLWIAICGYDEPTAITVSAYPANYTDDQTNIRDNFAGGQAMGAATRSLNAATEDPGTFTITTTEDWLAATIAVRPAAAGGVTATPGKLSLTLSTFAPVVTASDNKVATPGVAALTLATFAPSINIGVNVIPGVAALVLTPFAPTVAITANQVATIGQLALTLATFAPTIVLPQLVTVGKLSLVLTPFAPQVNLAIIPGTAALTLTPFTPVVTTSNNQVAMPGKLALILTAFAPAIGIPQTVTPGKLSLILTTFAPGVSTAVVVPIVMHRLHGIQYHGIIFSPDANGGPGLAKMEITPDMLNLVWNQALNGAGQAALTLTRFNPKIASLNFMSDHIKIYRETSAGLRTVFAGKLVKPSEGTRDVIIYAWDYMAFLQRSRTGFKVLYPQKLIGTEIVSPEWVLAKGVADSPFAFVANGTFEDPLALDGITAIKTNDQFGVSDFDRLFTFYALSELSMANTSNSVVFEITREAPHTFNFWKNKGTVKTNWHVEYPGNVVDYDLNTGQDEITNDIATPIIDPTTGQQVEYVVSDPVSIAAYRRLQAAMTIRTLYGVASGATETDQQKAAAARLLTQAVLTPKLLVVFPRQGELEVFNGWDLGDQFRGVLRRADRAGDRIDATLRAVGIGGSWSAGSGELLQVYLR